MTTHHLAFRLKVITDEPAKLVMYSLVQEECPQTYKFCRKLSRVSKVTNMVMVQNFEATSDNLNIVRMGRLIVETYVKKQTNYIIIYICR